MKADIEIENENMNEELQEELSSPQKRGSPLKSSSGNPRRKKQKHSSRDKQKPPDGAVDDKENNGRHPSPSDSNMSKSHEPESGNDFLVGRNKNPKNRPPEAGVITKIHVENFMWYGLFCLVSRKLCLVNRFSFDLFNLIDSEFVWPI